MYKDKDKQRDAVKLATRRYRAKGITAKGITGITKVSHSKGITTDCSVIPRVTSCTVTEELTRVPRSQSHNPMMVGYVPPGRTT